jgi:hypothetical protein
MLKKIGLGLLLLGLVGCNPFTAFAISGTVVNVGLVVGAIAGLPLLQNLVK